MKTPIFNQVDLNRLESFAKRMRLEDPSKIVTPCEAAELLGIIKKLNQQLIDYDEPKFLQ